MCLILLAYRVHPRYELVLGANRDEFYRRPSAPMDFREDVLAGKDLREGGTWLGIRRNGRFAAITNYRDPRAVKPGAPSRGHLVGDFLAGGEPAAEYLRALQSRAGDYNGFNLLLGEAGELWWYSNRDGAPQRLAPGFHGLSNHLLDTPWPKVRRGVAGLKKLAGAETITPQAVLSLLQDRTPAADRELPDTGVGTELERLLSPLWIESPEYGTRSSTALLIGSDRTVRVVEKNYDDGQLREFRLRWPLPQE